MAVRLAWCDGDKIKLITNDRFNILAQVGTGSSCWARHGEARPSICDRRCNRSLVIFGPYFLRECTSVQYCTIPRCSCSLLNINTKVRYYFSAHIETKSKK